jgi:hypothetical protein
LCERDLTGRLPLCVPLFQYADQHCVAADLLDGSAVFAASSIEQRQRIASSQPQYPGDMISSASLERQTPAGL